MVLFYCIHCLLIKTTVCSKILHHYTLHLIQESALSNHSEKNMKKAHMKTKPEKEALNPLLGDYNQSDPWFISSLYAILRCYAYRLSKKVINQIDSNNAREKDHHLKQKWLETINTIKYKKEDSIQTCKRVLLTTLREKTVAWFFAISSIFFYKTIFFFTSRDFWCRQLLNFSNV